MTSHRRWNTPEYRIWQQMIQRCHNPKRPQYRYWGGRGIVVCDLWRHSFVQFFADVGLRPSAQHTLDRIDNDGNYEPGNVRWATLSQQSGNRRRPRKGSNANGRPNTSSFKGVSYKRHLKTKPWVARLYVNGRDRCLGCFATEQEAADAYAKAAGELHLPLVAS